MSRPEVTGRKLPSRVVCERYSICGRTLSRWEQATELDFPQPTVINRRKYYDEDDLIEWDRKRTRGTRDGRITKRPARGSCRSSRSSGLQQVHNRVCR